MPRQFRAKTYRLIYKNRPNPPYIIGCTLAALHWGKYGNPGMHNGLMRCVHIFYVAMFVYSSNTKTIPRLFILCFFGVTFGCSYIARLAREPFPRRKLCIYIDARC